MKRFILRSVLFLLVVAAVLVGWELCMRNFPHVFGYKKTVIVENCRKDGETVVLGNSHAFFGANTDILPHAYNLSYAAQALPYDQFIFEYLVSKPHKLKYVVIPISIFSLFELRQKEEWRRNYYVRYWGYPAEKFSDNFFILDNNVPHQVLYVRKHAKKLKRKGILDTFHISATGWGTSYKGKDNIVDFTQAGKAVAIRHCNVQLDKTENFDALKAIVKCAQQHNIKVILYTPPGHKSYVTHLNKAQEEKMRALIDEISAEKGVFFLDLLRSQDFGDDDYFDPDHLNHQGAKKLTLKLHSFYKDK